MSTVPDPDKPTPAAIVAEQEALAPGTRFGELEIVRVLGVGGFGIVYLARDHSLERDVALKEYMPSALAVRGQGPQITVRSGALSETYAVGLRSFINEARLLAKFDHPSLVKVYRFWEDNATAYMVMPYLQGRTLREARRAMGAPPDEAWIRSVIEPILGALDVLHRDGVFHRDIAPDNILLPHEGPPVLLDFGAARRVISDRTQSLTAILKPNYAPIEQYAEMTSLRQGPWTDLYALGAVVHFLLAGAPPAPATARALQDEMQPLWARTFAGVSERFLAAIDWMLAVRPQERPQSVDALRAVLDGRAEPPSLARTVPGATSLMPVGGAQPTTVYEPTQLAPTRPEPPFPATQRAEPPTSAQRLATTVAPAAVPVPTVTAAHASAPAPFVPPAAAHDAPPAGSRKGLVGAALAVAVVLAAAAGWQVLETRGTADTAGPATATAPVAPAPAPTAAPVVEKPTAEAPAAPAAPAVLTATPAAADATPAAAETKPVAAAPIPAPATSPAVPLAFPAPTPTARTGRPVPAATAAVRATPPVPSTAVPAEAPDAATAEPSATQRPANPIPTAGAEPTRAERVRALRESVRAQRQAQQEAAATAPTPARPLGTAPYGTVPLGAPVPGTVPLGAPQPGDAPLGAPVTGPPTAREACGNRVLVALWNCMQRECRRPRYAQQADCVQINEERRAREQQ